VKLCKEQVEWARGEKRTFLRQRIEARLGTLYLETKDYPVRPFGSLSVEGAWDADTLPS